MTDLVADPVASTVTESKRSTAVRWAELGLVLFVALAQPLLASIYGSLHGLPPRAMYTGSLHFLSGVVQELGALFVLWYVLHRSGRTFSSLGLKLTLRGSLVGLGLAVACALAYYVTAAIIQIGHHGFFGTFVGSRDIGALFMAGGLFGLVPFVLLNPLFEETIVRGFLMSEVSELSGSAALAIIASVAIQVGYHTYQGWFAAACISSVFLVLAVYYARTRKLFPVIVAHAAFDWLLLLRLLLSSRHS